MVQRHVVSFRLQDTLAHTVSMVKYRLCGKVHVSNQFSDNCLMYSITTLYVDLRTQWVFRCLSNQEPSRCHHDLVARS